MNSTTEIFCTKLHPVDLDGSPAMADFEYSEEYCVASTTSEQGGVNGFTQGDIVVSVFVFLIWITILFGYTWSRLSK